MLRRKVLRDMRQNKGSYTACLLLIAMGLTVFIAFSIANDNFTVAKQTLYAQGRFAEGFAEVSAMPESDLHRLRRIEGVAQISGRLVEDVRVLPAETGSTSVAGSVSGETVSSAGGTGGTIYLRLVSKDLEDLQRLNDSTAVWGDPMRSRERHLWINAGFAEEHGLEIDDTISVVAGGRAHDMQIRGAMLNPEFVYIMREDSHLFPDPYRFGVATVPLDTMWELFPDQRGIVNDIVFTLEPGTEYRRVEELLELELEGYGLKRIYPRDDHNSHLLLEEESEVLTSFATFFPVLMLGVAAFVLYIVLKRLVQQQRGQIGILKSCGYTRAEITRHYLSYSVILAVMGGIIGSVLGMLAANTVSRLLFEYFELPEVYAGFSLRYFFFGTALCVGVLGVAGYQGVKHVLRLSPAEAMLPPAPPPASKTIFDSAPWFTRMLTTQGLMGVRNISRAPGRSGFLLLGIAMSFMLVAANYSMMAVNMPMFLFHQLTELETYDVRISLRSPQPRRAVLREVEALPFVTRAEVLARVPVTLSHRLREEDIELLGLPEDNRLYNILDAEGNRITPSAEGLIISERLATNLKVRRGDTITLQSPYLRGTRGSDTGAEADDKIQVPIVAVIPQYIGMNAYLEVEALERMLGQPAFTSAVLIRGEGEGEGEEVAAMLSEHYRDSDVVTAVDSRQRMVGNLEEMWELFSVFLNLFALIGAVFSFAIIYIAAFVTLSERSRELASMRVLGMTPKEVFSVIAFEQWFLSFFGILLGLLPARYLVAGFAASYTTDMYTMPAHLPAEAIVVGISATLVSIWIAQRFALRRVRSLSLVEVLRERE